MAISTNEGKKLLVRATSLVIYRKVCGFRKEPARVRSFLLSSLVYKTNELIVNSIVVAISVATFE